MKITKRDRDVDFFESLSEKENPSKRKDKKSSNGVFIICAIAVCAVLAFYITKFNENTAIKNEIKMQTEYMADDNNKSLYAAQLELSSKIKKIEDYNIASDTFLQQLKNSRRFSSHTIDFYRAEMEKAIGPGNEILQFDFSGDSISLTCRVGDRYQPSAFADYLSTLTKEDGTPMFANVPTYVGWTETGGKYDFVLTLTLRKVAGIDN